MFITSVVFCDVCEECCHALHKQLHVMRCTISIQWSIDLRKRHYTKHFECEKGFEECILWHHLNALLCSYLGVFKYIVLQASLPLPIIDDVFLVGWSELHHLCGKFCPIIKKFQDMKALHYQIIFMSRGSTICCVRWSWGSGNNGGC